MRHPVDIPTILKHWRDSLAPDSPDVHWAEYEGAARLFEAMRTERAAPMQAQARVAKAARSGLIERFRREGDSAQELSDRIFQRTGERIPRRTVSRLMQK